MSIEKQDTSASSKRQIAKRKPFRRDIQGLRALAVLLVVANHISGWPYGGFIGVDVFFVISGYLITSQLLREQRSTGWISISSFYARRLRRIVPVATLVAAVTVLASYLFWLAPRNLQTLLDGIASVLWVSNWHFAALGTDYLAPDEAVSPLQHYWSLSVEEQFYVVMPWAVIMLGALAIKFQKPQRTIIFAFGFATFRTQPTTWESIVIS